MDWTICPECQLQVDLNGDDRIIPHRGRHSPVACYGSWLPTQEGAEGTLPQVRYIGDLDEAIVLYRTFQRCTHAAGPHANEQSEWRRFKDWLRVEGLPSIRLGLFQRIWKGETI